MNPLKVIIIKPEDPNAFSEGVQVIGAIVWVAGLWMYWSGANWFDNTIGRVCFVPALLAAAVIGYSTTLFVIGASFFITIVGLLIGWIFDFPFFEKTLNYIGIAYRYLFK
jgi:hypothetical protein